MPTDAIPAGAIPAGAIPDDDIPDGAIRVQARLTTGASLLLADTTPLSERLLGAVSFYVWAALDDEQPGDAETYT